jgi:exodeoxyribonuclease VII small subunit
MKKNDTTISDKMAKLGELVAWFDSDEFQLEIALEKFAEAEALAQEIEEDLTHLKNDIDVVKKKFDQA